MAPLIIQLIVIRNVVITVLLGIDALSAVVLKKTEFVSNVFVALRGILLVRLIALTMQSVQKRLIALSMELPEGNKSTQFSFKVVVKKQSARMSFAIMRALNCAGESNDVIADVWNSIRLHC